MTEWLILISIILVGVILILSLRKFSDLSAEVNILKWISLKLIGKETQGDNGREHPDADIQALIKRFNEDFCRAVVSGDSRYLSATMTQPGLSRARQYIENLSSSMQRTGTVSCSFVTYSLVGQPTRSGKQAIVHVDETWEYRFADGRTSQATTRNTYALVLVDREWRVESFEALKPFMTST